MNIVERSSCFKPSKMLFSVELRNNNFLKSLANQHKDHPSTVNIRQSVLKNTHMDTSSFSTDEVTCDKVNSIIKSLDWTQIFRIKLPVRKKYQCNLSF